jgi:tetratricopeptide (TPR) repeat protein
VTDLLQGTIAQGRLPPLLRDLYLGRRTGLLHFTRGTESGSVCFIKGHIAWGQSSIEECRLGPVLVRHGLIAQESIDQAYEIVGGGKRLGDVLLEGGALDRDTLDQALALQVRETLLAVFAWTEGSWRFEEHPAEFFKGYDDALHISTGDLILDAVWSVADPEVVTYALGDLDRPIALTTDPLLRFQRIALTEMDGRLVSLADGVRTAAEILELSPNDSQEAQRSLFGLLCTGLLEAVDSFPPIGEVSEPLTREEILDTHRLLPTRDHFEVLGLARSATLDQIREAFVRLARRFHPDVQHQPELAGLGTQIEEIFTRLADADRVLSAPPRRAEYERRLSLSEVQTLLHSSQAAPPPRSEDPSSLASPEEMVAQAEREQEEGHHWDALTAIDAVVGGLQGRLRRRAWLVRARALAQNPKWRKEAEDQAKQVLAEDPASADALFVLGEIYRAGGLETRAVAAFRKALELRPRHAGARAALGG